MDDIDWKIISQLEVDGRTTLEKLGKITGYTSMGVKKRVEKLLKQKAMKISAQLNPRYFNLCSAIILIEVESSEVMHRLLRRFKDCPRVVYLFTAIGGYNLIALVIAENQETLESISVEKCSLRSEKGIRRSEFYPISSIYYSPFLPIRERLTHRNLTISPCGVDCRPCERYKYNRCVGCPATKYYRGTL